MQSLISTLSKYPAFLAGIMIGVVLNAFKPLAPLMKNPITALALLGFAGASLAFLTFTLQAMLELNGPVL
jgi:hypothetical protein